MKFAGAQQFFSFNFLTIMSDGDSSTLLYCS